MCVTLSVNKFKFILQNFVLIFILTFNKSGANQNRKNLCLTSDLPPSVSMQTCSQTELENWITAIHSACATAVARQHHREDTVRLLRAEIKKLEQKIDMDEKMKKMGDMQLSAVTDNKKRKTILDQVGVKSPFFLELMWSRCVGKVFLKGCGKFILSHCFKLSQINLL